jgi:endonuclease/exonuclease/phosphatase family metal-dependent hydrolase
MARDGLWIKLALLAAILLMLGGVRVFRPEARETAFSPALDLTGEGWRVRVLTWNIGLAYGRSDSRAQNTDLERVARVIRMELPDVVALQELAGQDQLNELLGRLEGEFKGFLHEGTASDRYAAVLVRATGSLFRAIPTSTGRHASAAIFRLARSPLRVCAISAHAQAWDAGARREYTRELVDWARGKDFDVVLLAGDFNFDSASDPGREVLFRTDRRLDREAYDYVTRHFRDLGRDGGGTSLLGRRIDYIFARGGKLQVKRVAVLKGRGTGRMDHDPLVIDALIPKPVLVSRH